MTILLFFVVLFVLVLVHELGHFVVAKRSGMRVDEFGIGFPPRLGSVRWGETDYSINAMPIGGFVKIYGEDATESLDAPDAKRAFSARPRSAQALVLIAGVAMNILFAWLLFSVAFMVGATQVVEESAASDRAQLTVLSVLPESPAEEAGIRPGDRIVSLVNENGHPSELTPSAAALFIADYGTVTIGYERGGDERTAVMRAASGIAPDNTDRPVVGVVMGFVEFVSVPPHRAIADAAVHTASTLTAIVAGVATLLYDALSLNADLSHVAGPIGIAGLVGEAAAFGLTSLLMFTAIISLNLAVINLLPFPALDGGRLLFVCIEAVKGSPLSPRIAQNLNMIGFGLLILLMVAVTFQDIARLL